MEVINVKKTAHIFVSIFKYILDILSICPFLVYCLWMNLVTWPSYRSKLVSAIIQHVVKQIDYFNKVNVKILLSLFFAFYQVYRFAINF